MNHIILKTGLLSVSMLLWGLQASTFALAADERRVVVAPAPGRLGQAPQRMHVLHLRVDRHRPRTPILASEQTDIIGGRKNPGQCSARP